ncbi:hypothetical protein OG594_43215 [Streptomyces sp. NBC_01214]|uniref:hypothetical protein n=1 Tax=Streptomyces sp. NBC_01214 TaxID=2903777 RepID=UPI002250C4AF|nr:hypothetical protein [Streptomyces sp. NBC_01214]MCX4808324.1 hypothetical protein [Streptomyces sp. NBC_01214]
MHDSHDPLRSLFQEAASAGQSASTTPPVAVIERRGERHRRHRIVGIAAACFLVLAGSGAVLSAFLPGDSGPTLPATTPSPVAPSPTSAPPPPSNSTPPTLNSMTPPRNTTPPPPLNSMMPSGSRTTSPVDPTGTATMSAMPPQSPR